MVPKVAIIHLITLGADAMLSFDGFGGEERLSGAMCISCASRLRLTDVDPFLHAEASPILDANAHAERPALSSSSLVHVSQWLIHPPSEPEISAAGRCRLVS